MGIDGIKGPGSGAPPAGIEPTSDAGFEDALGSAVEGKAVEGKAVEGAAQKDAVSGALARLQAGEISVDEYLDTQVRDAVRHLEGKISREQLEFVQDSLREQLRQDPVLVELVHRTTGATLGE